MPKSRLSKILRKILTSLRILMVAWMIGIANSINQEAKFMDDTQIKIEIVEGQEDDEPFQEIE